MKKDDVVKQYTTPIAAPAFVQGPHRFKRREYLNITYRTDREALAKLVPEPLEIDQPLVRFEVMPAWRLRRMRPGRGRTHGPRAGRVSAGDVNRRKGPS